MERTKLVERAKCSCGCTKKCKRANSSEVCQKDQCGPFSVESTRIIERAGFLVCAKITKRAKLMERAI